jgi:hypothetical protein
LTDAITGRSLILQEGFLEWLSEQPPIIVLHQSDYEATIVAGSPDRDGDRGYTLTWHDGVINEWAEHFTDLATALARLAALERAVQRQQFFRDGPEYFVRWSENFFNQSVSDPNLPVVFPEQPEGD